MERFGISYRATLSAMQRLEAEGTLFASPAPAPT